MQRHALKTQPSFLTVLQLPYPREIVSSSSRFLQTCARNGVVMHELQSHRHRDNVELIAIDHPHYTEGRRGNDYSLRRSSSGHSMDAGRCSRSGSYRPVAGMQQTSCTSLPLSIDGTDRRTDERTDTRPLHDSRSPHTRRIGSVVHVFDEIADVATQRGDAIS